MISIQKTDKQLENDRMVDFLINHPKHLSNFLEWFYDEGMLTDILQEDIAADDIVTCDSLAEFVGENEEDYEDWVREQGNNKEDRNGI
jgi:hypothetical protein